MYFSCAHCSATVDQLDTYCNGCGSKLNWRCVTIEKDDMTYRGEVPA